MRQGLLPSGTGREAMKHAAAPRPAVFLDRDGTLITECNYLSRPEQVCLLPGAADAVRRLRSAGFVCVIVSNQSGVGRGLFTHADLEAVHAEMLRQLHAAGAVLDATYYCTAGPPTPADPIEHPDRKPNPGMLLRAARDLNLDLPSSWIVGDSLRDIQAGRNAGCRSGILVRTGHDLAEALATLGSAALVVDNLLTAAQMILDQMPLLPGFERPPGQPFSLAEE